MKLRKLRIAFSTVCGILCLLLIVLWLRSTSIAELFIVKSIGTRYLGLGSINGAFSVFASRPQLSRPPIANWEYSSLTLAHSQPIWLPRWERYTETTELLIPYWLALIVDGGMAAAPWTKWRFSLRTLLIATTLVAVVLGLLAIAR